MDPYDVLGINYNSNWKQIRKAYKNMLVQTHPDKMGNAKYFMMVHEAFASIKKQHEAEQNQRSYPTEHRKYSTEKNNVQKPQEQFNINSFNKMFNEYSKLYNKSDPFLNGGYKTGDRLNHQEDMSTLKNAKVHIPKRELILYKEPEALASSSLMENVCHLGVNKIDDYTCSHGADYMRAYSEEAELIDNRKDYKNIDEIKQARANQSFKLSEEDKRKQAKLERKKQKLEQMRRQQMQKNDTDYERIHSYIQNRLK